MKSSYLNIKEAEKEKYIYRIMSFERMVEMFLTNKMTLVKPILWEDPFENFILNYFEKQNKRDSFDFNFRNSIYANCWTLQNRSDALWRIQSPNKDGVCLRTTTSNLFEALYKQRENISCFIGKVVYILQGEIYKKLDGFKKQFDSKPKGSGLAETILFKRTAFQHEKEIRLIIHNPTPNNKDFFKLDFSPHLIFDQITFDPRMGENTYRALSKYIKEVIGFKGRVRQSSLYKIPKKYLS